ncbi:Variable outer membrane protein [Borrelia duttonii CR2A]|uniref:Variable large protein n=1 Tax=Borrelia duttonii CR2A TaxID=1432657 RepID=W6TEU4_9SPIR|nr:Variable outer membrane protein [Borrelia duttonii CR2A]
MKEEKNPNVEVTESAVKTLVENTLDKIIAGAKEASEAIGDSGDPIGNIAANNAGGAAGADVEKLVKGIKGIVDIVLKGVGNAEAGNDKKASDGSTARTANGGNDEAGKLFGNAAIGAADNAKKTAADASKAVGAVTGADILQAIVKNGSNSANNAAVANAKDGTIAGAIALRAMAKGGKFANDNDGTAEVTTAVKGAVVSAVTKALDTLTVAIRKTIDLGLKNVKDVMKINSNANPVVSDKDAAGAQNQ